ncbi:MAG: DUF4249 family protein [Bacteroidales bacterium]|jgi:hypothetical protein
MKYPILVLIILLIAVSCVSISDDLLPNHKKQMYMQSVLSPDSVVKVYVGYTADLRDKGFVKENGATVILYQNDVIIDTLNTIGNGIYVSEIKPQVNTQYLLRVYHQDDTIFALTTVPDYPIICNAPTYKYPTYYDTQDEAEFGDLYIEIDDPAGIDNYYEIILFARTQNEKYKYVFYDQQYVRITDGVLINEGDWNYNPTSIFFSDLLFDGQCYKMKLIVSPRGAHIYDVGGVVEVSTLLDESGYVLLRSISKEYYLYRKLYTRHVYNSQSDFSESTIYDFFFIGEPLNMYTNVSNGVGVFASVNSKLYKIKKYEK